MKIESELYYWNEETQSLMPHPWHYSLFADWAWYRKLTGWNWKSFRIGFDYVCWHRVK